jgi:hypothetical protein
MKRYSLNDGQYDKSEKSYCTLYEDENGEWVKYEDYKKEIYELEKLLWLLIASSPDKSITIYDELIQENYKYHSVIKTRDDRIRGYTYTISN